MKKNVKNFRDWSKVAEELERAERLDFCKPGAIYWCCVGAGVGSELSGKGRRYTRPVLVLAKIDKRLVTVLPITSQDKDGSHYANIIVNGKTESVVLYQAMNIDILRLQNFIDELAPEEFSKVKAQYVRFIKRQLYRKN